MARKTIRMKPLYDNIVVNPIDGETRTPSGIIIPESAESPSIYKRGSVEAIGTGLEDMPHQVQYKDIVLFPKNAGIKVEEDGVEYLLLSEADIAARL